MLNLREHVVYDVVLDNAVEDVTADESELAIDCGCSALGEGPVLGFVVSCFRVSVVKVGNSNYGELVFSISQLGK